MAAPFPSRCALRFRAEKLIASGGFGSVWLATQVDLGRPVAVKLLHEGILEDDDQRERFVNEARVTASLSHPSIVKIVDHDVEAGVPWIAYEYLPGPTLRERLRGGAPLPWADAVAAACQVAAALEEAHRQGVLHRDVKPDNVIEVESGRFKITDFGIAKWTSSSLRTQAGVILGTPAQVGALNMSGNAAEWCEDTYAPNAFSSSAARNPVHAVPGPEKVTRGGSFVLASNLGAIDRSSLRPDWLATTLGFRGAMSAVSARR